MSTLEGVQYRGYHEYSGGDIVSMPEGYHEYNGGYHEYTGGGGCSVHRGFSYKFNCFPNDLPHIYHDIPPVYS